VTYEELVEVLRSWEGRIVEVAHDSSQAPSPVVGLWREGNHIPPAEIYPPFPYEPTPTLVHFSVLREVAVVRSPADPRAPRRAVGSVVLLLRTNNVKGSPQRQGLTDL
jgi:hypothetical protein